MTPEEAAALRAPFPPEHIGKLPRAGIELDYVGHAHVTERLLEVDPAWSWEPVAWAADGAPLIGSRGTDAVLWVRLTVCGVTRLGVGIVSAKAFELEKQLISDALRNAAMRFGVALDLWKKDEPPATTNAPRRSARRSSSPPANVDADTGEVEPSDEISAMSPRALHAALEGLGLDSTGSVAEMRQRLRSFHAEDAQREFEGAA